MRELSCRNAAQNCSRPHAGLLAPHHYVERRPNLNLASIDLNLLVALEALLEARNVTHAGWRVGKSQPAMSRALAMLRDIFNDELLVRGSRGFVLTSQGERLALMLPSALNAIRKILVDSSVPTGEWRSKATIAVPDHQTLILLPRLMQRAPDLEIVFHSLFKGTLRALEDGDIDLAIGQIAAAPPGYLRRRLYTDHFVCLLRHDHPSLAQERTIESVMALRHAAISSDSGSQVGQIYDVMPELGLPDRRMRFSNVLTAAMVAATSDMALVVPHRAAMRFSAMLPLRAVDLPIKMEPYEVALIWHERCHRDPEHKWLRGEIAAALTAGAD
ncbi:MULTISPECIES: LysR family transcriptional regulator [Mesorhizobium]|uniref:DNA-binding transcriptional regulator, LysR family n=1 Tax=Mesorhizobium qingshengii TaxID=1165689 RepID=A0A1G5ZZ12_9HYPH|nr:MULTISPECIES: LysR family transcriptional regulator [Mesorhizobium]AID34506.1 LysR family transcriptional regulator [Mesorhizobium huakuii 7653R]MCH4561361.1 LysR family transcriptional regulator [Mesorhizobium jarvisii]SDA99942.1 DNA-binding transcriptional regulator, LysR family [Mesorhizobium qingshengii]